MLDGRSETFHSVAIQGRFTFTEGNVYYFLCYINKHQDHRARSSLSRYRGPSPNCAATSPGFHNRHDVSERHPQPMHSLSWSRIRVNTAMRSSRRGCQVFASLAQSRELGVRPSGNVANASRISLRFSPTSCAVRMKLTRLSTSAWKRRCPDSVRSDRTRP